VTFSTQEILLFRNAASREIVVGAENRVEQCVYAAVITRVSEEMADEVTGGWKVIEVGLVSRSHLLILIFFCADGTPVCKGVSIVVLIEYQTGTHHASFA
jgi:hypothetical protein